MAGDPVSLDILFVAVCRSLGVPSRLHPSEQKPQYMADGVWIDAVLNASVPHEEAAKSWARSDCLRMCTLLLMPRMLPTSRISHLRD
ncbi:hypothetical protein RE628_18785 [Paenibacillus sp. D2_2]|uniref:hypothetical protein n=1 Tax=Paenibacillus sp. D2_2 TaxID=3073092 RepID=UPI0028154D3C|nr:hypothetical protein [Paenibacillus sp. D2_2]WMT39461.1 hypothetical protein RE628_18785 [Paenibacillus sp. D2_2]